MKDLSFGDAINLVKEGQLVSRKGWNGKGMFVFMRPADSLPMDFLDKVKSLPQKVKDYFLSNPTEELTHVEFTGYLCMKSADNKIVNGWLASQTDMLATDWQVFEA